MKLGWIKYREGLYIYGDKELVTSGRGGPRFMAWLGRIEKGHEYYSGWYARHVLFDTLPETEYFSDFQTAREWVKNGVADYIEIRDMPIEEK